MAHEIKSPNNQPQFSQTTKGQYWLGKAYFQIDLLQKIATESKKEFSRIFYRLTN